MTTPTPEDRLREAEIDLDFAAKSFTHAGADDCSMQERKKILAQWNAARAAYRTALLDVIDEDVAGLAFPDPEGVASPSAAIARNINTTVSLARAAIAQRKETT